MINKSTLVTVVPVIEALYNAPKALELSMDWKPINDFQTMVIGMRNVSEAIAKLLDNKQLASIASSDAAVVNDFLAVSGFPEVKLKDRRLPGCFYAAGVIKLLGHFFNWGEVGYTLHEIDRPAFRFGVDDGVRHYDFDDQRIVEIPTQSGFSLYISRPFAQVEGFQLLNSWETALGHMVSVSGNGVVMPGASIDSLMIDVSELVGMTSEDWTLMEAVMAAKLELGPNAISFESAFAYAAAKSPKPRLQAQANDYIADHALNVALAFPGYSFPLAAGVVAVEDLSTSF